MKFPVLVMCLLFGGFAHAQLQRYCQPLVETIERGQGDTSTFYMAGECYAHNGNNERAFEYLNLAADNGWNNLEQLQNAKVFEQLRLDARWAGLVTKVESQIKIASRTNNGKIRAIFEADQADFEAISVGRDARAKQRRTQILSLEVLLKSTPDFYQAASVMLRGETHREIQKAHEFARKAYELDDTYKDVGLLLARAEDKWLHQQGQPQVWGTHKIWKDGAWTKEPFDRSYKTEAQRHKRGLLPLKESEARKKGD